MRHTRHQLGNLARRLLDEATPSDELAPLCAELSGCLLEATALAADRGEAFSPVSTHLPTGLALSPRLAAQCLLDTSRSVAFLRGLSNALDVARQRFPSGILEVIYAGCGPLAPLVLPLMAARALPGARFTFLDCHPGATASVLALIHHLGFEHRVGEVVEVDAAEYTHPRAVHLVVTETLQRSLAIEPFVSIVRNLRRQLVPGGLLIPERVAVDLCLFETSALRPHLQGLAPLPPGQRVARLFEIDAAEESPPLDASGRSVPVVVTLPEEPPGVERSLAWTTDIRTFESRCLELGASGLTVPEILWPLSPAQGGAVVEFQYVVDQTPGLRWRRLSSRAQNSPAAGLHR